MPDPLTWQAGIEYGLQALTAVQETGSEFLCYLADAGPLLEAVSLSVYQLDLTERVRYVSPVQGYLKGANAILLPRVYSLDREIIGTALKAGQWVISSDPAVTLEHPRLLRFPCRDWRAMADILTRLEAT
jgi:hypothetical protein